MTASPRPAPQQLVFEWEQTRHSIAEDVLGIVTGTFVVALGLHLLKAVGAVTGGTAGLALLIDQLSDIPFWLIFTLVNAPFVALALWKKGVRFTVLTALCVGGVAGLSVVNAAWMPAAGLQPVYAVVGGNLLVGVGLLILFRHGASVGGVNIIAILVQERTGFRAGWTQMIVDVLIIAAAFVAAPWPLVLLSAAGAVILNLVLALNHRPGRYIGH
ncbi:YitT family protein [Microbacterium sediminis]|uniref:YitT family protein n=1 Tax=Microbacterium sediminis TaxID=904291 RepID=UPI0010728804|nr:YitT family protein [Microbacterium sediminis]QBR75030.1 YitT family protein [Microbacterium sediminis]